MALSPIKLAVLVSGSGTTLANLIDQIAAKKLDARVEMVIGSRPGLLGVQRANDAGLRNEIVNRKEHADVASFSREVFKLCDESKADLICLAGWLCLLDVPDRWHGRIMNIHPALLPSFGGKGMFGHHVHEAVLKHRCKISGCTVHFVNSNYDEGPIIVQKTCPVMEGDTPSTLAARVFEQEKIAYPEAIRLFGEGKLSIEGTSVKIKG